MRSARSLCAMVLLLALRALPAQADPGLLSGSLLDKVVQLNPVITGNTLSASITLAGGITADLTITFEQAVGLNANALSISAQLLDPLSLLGRLPNLTSLPLALPVLIRIQPTAQSALTFSGVYNLSIYTNVLTFANVLRVYRGPNGGPLQDMTGKLEMGSVRAGGSGPGFSDFVIVVDLRAADAVINEKINRLDAAVEANAGSMPPTVYGDLRAAVQQIRASYQAGRVQEALDATIAFGTYVKTHSGSDIPDVWQANSNLVNVAGTLRSLADTLRFSLVVRLN